MYEALPGARAVHRRRLVELLPDALESREEVDHVEPRPSPDAGQHEGGHDQVRILKPLDFETEDPVYQAVPPVVQQVEDHGDEHAGDQHRREEGKAKQVSALQACVAEEKGEGQGHGQLQEQAARGEIGRVPERGPEERVGEQPLDVLESHEGLVPHAPYAVGAEPDRIEQGVDHEDPEEREERGEEEVGGVSGLHSVSSASICGDGSLISPLSFAAVVSRISARTCSARWDSASAGVRIPLAASYTACRSRSLASAQ